MANKSQLAAGIVLILIALLIVTSKVHSNTVPPVYQSIDPRGNEKIITWNVTDKSYIGKWVDIEIERINDTTHVFHYKVNQTFLNEAQTCINDPQLNQGCFKDLRDKWELTGKGISQIQTDLRNLSSYPVKNKSPSVIINKNKFDLTAQSGFFTVTNDGQIGRKLNLGFSTISTETVESTNDVGDWASLAVDTSNVVHIAHQESAFHDSIRYCSGSSGSFTCEDILDGTDESRSYNKPSIDLNGTDIPFVSSVNLSSNNIVISKKVGGSWMHEEVTGSDASSQGGNAIAIDSNGFIHNVHYTPDKLVKYCNDEGGWSCQNIINNSGGTTIAETSIALNSTGGIFITARDDSVSRVALCKSADGSSFNCNTADSVNSGIINSVAIDQSDDIHIAHLDNTAGDDSLRYCKTTDNGNTFNCEKVLDESNISGTGGIDTISIAIDINNEPNVYYLGYHCLKDGTWSCTDFDSGSISSQNEGEWGITAVNGRRGSAAGTTDNYDTSNVHMSYDCNDNLCYATFPLEIPPEINSFELNVEELGDSQNLTLKVNSTDLNGLSDRDKGSFESTIINLNSNNPFTLDISDTLSQSGTLKVNDSVGDSDNRTLNWTLTENSLEVEDRYSHSLDTQMIRYNDSLTNDDTTYSLEINISHTKPSGGTESTSDYFTATVTNNTTLHNIISNYTGDTIEENISTNWLQDTTETTESGNTAYILKEWLNVTHNGTFQLNFSTINASISLTDRSGWTCNEKKGTFSLNNGSSSQFKYPINCTKSDVITETTDVNSILSYYLTNQSNVTVNETMYYTVNVTVENTDNSVSYDSVKVNISDHNPDLSRWSNLSKVVFTGNSFSAGETKQFKFNMSGTAIDLLNNTEFNCPSNYTKFTDFCKKETSQTDGTKYNYRFFLDVPSNISKNYDIVFKYPFSELVDWSESSSVLTNVNQSSAGVTFNEDSTNVIWTIDTTYGSSSLHEGTWYVNLEYEVTDQTGGGGGGGGGTTIIQNFLGTVSCDPGFEKKELENGTTICTKGSVPLRRVEESLLVPVLGPFTLMSMLIFGGALLLLGSNAGKNIEKKFNIPRETIILGVIIMVIASIAFSSIDTINSIPASNVFIAIREGIRDLWRIVL